MSFYTTVGEDDISSDTTCQYYTMASSWAELGGNTGAICAASAGDPCTPLSPLTLESDPNYFLIGDYEEAPNDK